MTEKPLDPSTSLKAGLAALRAELDACFGPRARFNEALAAHTTLRLGGPADLWFPARSVAELFEVVGLARQRAVPVFLLGGGANLLIGSAGARGLVIENRARVVRFEGARVIAESGTILPRLAKRCAQQGLSGLEWAVGVPGTIGGAAVNNAGAYGMSMADILIRAEILTPQGERIWQPVEWFEYEYRFSKLKQGDRETRGQGDRGTGGQGDGGTRGYVILQVELALVPASTAEVEATMRKYTARRKATQPPGATIGSMFKNPPGDYAGRLIEAVGLKGYRIGQAQISPVHANFFVNLGSASADDVIELVKTAQEQVLDKFGVLLELEVEIV
ncbi:MAG TPA: UDP-N-acetylmuramate dehydrogenase [Chloroflexi bacterium]|nr:UDP-N-acetylmuramate dehydrogenase [Chloroflexota bacterium]